MQIINTLKCNFTCSHCLWSCSPSKNEFMSKNTFLRAVEMFYDGVVNLLGGETFLHPDIAWQIQVLSQSKYVEYIRIVTNGSWVFDKDGNYSKVFKSLKRADIDWTNVHFFVSNDQHHRAFISDEAIKEAKEVLENHFWGTTIERRWAGDRIDWYQPLGRARKNNYPYRGNYAADCTENYEDEGYISMRTPTVLPNGDVSPACCGHNIIGNIHYHDRAELEARLPYLKQDATLEDCATCPKYAKIPGMLTNMHVSSKCAV